MDSSNVESFMVSFADVNLPDTNGLIDFLAVRLPDLDLRKPDAAVFVRAAIRVLADMDEDPRVVIPFQPHGKRLDLDDLIDYYHYPIGDVDILSRDAGVLMRAAILTMDGFMEVS
ncbi:hypothetical protein [Magnetospira sp. QH-2]|uniref:hypothetical protein n=1 Tax=Magnetospira sp. (strain QH-2) TaxID=1288970 RepID=UPI0003E80C34|nr:hypothetical protein [Magnetospira sp. QH-2]CCQ72903.1 protein of unknown function [Magnetospira sp. QH-2]